MPQYLPEAREITSGAEKTASSLKVVAHVRNKVPTDYADFVASFAGASEERAVEWIRSHVISDENVSARAEIKALELNEGETQKDFFARVETVAQGDVDSWTCEKTRRMGTGATSRAKAADEIALMFAQGKSQEEINSKLADYAKRFGVTTE